VSPDIEWPEPYKRQRFRRPLHDPLTDPAGCGHRPVRLCERKVLKMSGLDDMRDNTSRKCLISSTLMAWLAALDDFRNWLIREAA
jgi:hypothetical protein